MNVDYGLFQEDELLYRGLLKVSYKETAESSGNLIITHKLLDNTAEIVIEIFSDGQRLIKSTLDMPIHQSDDWESIELDVFTYAFKCILNS